MASKLNRHQIDRIARAVVSGERGLGVRLDALAHAAAGLVTQQLAAARAPGRRGVRSKKSKTFADAETVRRLLVRIDEHLQHLALCEAIDDDLPTSPRSKRT